MYTYHLFHWAQVNYTQIKLYKIRAIIGWFYMRGRQVVILFTFINVYLWQN